MKRISSKLLIPVLFTIAFNAQINGAAVEDPGNLQEETIRILAKWKEGATVPQLDALIEEHIARCVAAGHNRFHLERRLWYVRRDAAKDIEKGEHPVHAFTKEKWKQDEKKNNKANLFDERPYDPVSPMPLPAIPVMPIPPKENSCCSCAIL